MQQLGFVINKEKSQFQPVQEIGFLGLVVFSISVTLALLGDKIELLKTQCEKWTNNQ